MKCFTYICINNHIMKQQSGVYCIIINNKHYIGSSINIKRRIIQHKSDLVCNKHCNQYLQNAYNKHGKIKVKILEVTNEKLEEKELYYINLLKAEYNIQNPETNFNVKKIHQFSKNGLFLKTYNSVTEASINLNISESHIRHAAQLNCKDTLSAGGFLWSYDKNIKFTKDKRYTSLHVYDISGRYVTSYLNLKSCIKELYPTRNAKDVQSVINRITKYKTASLDGYRFSYEKKLNLDNTKLLNIKKNYPIVQITYDGKNIIKVWDNIKSAANFLECSRLSITDAIIKNHRSQGFYWMRLGITKLDELLEPLEDNNTTT